MSEASTDELMAKHVEREREEIHDGRDASQLLDEIVTLRADVRWYEGQLQKTREKLEAQREELLERAMAQGRAEGLLREARNRIKTLEIRNGDESIESR